MSVKSFRLTLDSYCRIKQNCLYILSRNVSKWSRVPSLNHAEEQSYNKSKMFGFAGISFSFLALWYFHKREKFKILPSVSAASKISSPPVKINDNISNGGYRKHFNFIADVVEQVSDGVVSIKVMDHRRQNLSGEARTITTGSGVIIESDGLILTNAHVVANKPQSTSIVVRLTDGREFQGKIEEIDAVSDLALVRIKCDELQPMILGSSKDARCGEFVMALGSPLQLLNSITSGVISSVGRCSKELGLRRMNDINYIQTDASITFGNSGGPLVNLNGEVIGINSMKVIHGGISFAIPIDYAKEFITQAKKKKSILDSRKEGSADWKRRRYLGITVKSLTPEIILELQQSSQKGVPVNLTHGIFVWNVEFGSPAHYGGLLSGDIIISINGHKMESWRDLHRSLEGSSDLHMIVIRANEKYKVVITPEE